ncbi:hypothetical protein [Bradyrhizobium sp. NP1]|uniref:hypothetical protein n=1 Tax=Bradyrhizobium sp. NP1 TaxID=3049772 RepID=UPI0025A64B2F|nr:hypothetical protein [Bradyrhizobium sp. NP1]WJR79783.1 hypothetical protein QOU61_08450 [Bradyrhizobium sp. NP1]
MSTDTVIFLSAIAAAVLLVVVWACAPRASRGLRFWALGAGRGLGRLGSSLRKTGRKTSDG